MEKIVCSEHYLGMGSLSNCHSFSWVNSATAGWIWRHSARDRGWKMCWAIVTRFTRSWWSLSMPWSIPTVVQTEHNFEKLWSLGWCWGWYQRTLWSKLCNGQKNSTTTTPTSYQSLVSQDYQVEKKPCPQAAAFKCNVSRAECLQNVVTQHHIGITRCSRYGVNTTQHDILTTYLPHFYFTMIHPHSLSDSEFTIMRC